MDILLIMDPQNDFCNPGNDSEKKGTMYVPGAEKDMSRLSYFILANIKNLKHIVVTLDSHYYNDISHPNFWINKESKHPEPFSQISYEDVKNEYWMPMFAPERVKEYLKKLEEQGEYPHTIWPEHCLIGSEGAAIYKTIFEAITQWSKQGKFFQPVMKGQYPFSEHFGAFAAQVRFEDVADTEINTDLIDELGRFDKIFVGGQAKSHCVANTLKQMNNYAPGLVSKLIILEDTMSNVPGFENIADDIYKKSVYLGAKIAKTTDYL